jgi:nucleoid-associated protein Lsr2
MARKVEVRLVDDLDNSVAAETIVFALDGVSYEIDLSSKHATELRTGLDRFVQVAHRVGRGRITAPRGRTRRSAAHTAQNQAIREWAEAKGLEVAARGRIPRSIVEQYEARGARSESGGGRRRRS